jgi:hypothetical protein
MKKSQMQFWGIAACVLSAIATLAPLPVQADAFVYHFTNVISGTTGPASSPPWVNALFEDVSPGTVRLSVTNVGLSGMENVDTLDFNLNPSLAPSSLSFTYLGGSGGFDTPTISTGLNSFKADGDGYFDIDFAFSQDGQTYRFRAGQSMVYQISGIPGLTVSDFAYLSFDGGGQGQFYAGAHIQQIAISGQDSAWIGADQPAAVPEPSSSLLRLLAASLVLSFGLAQRRAKAGCG